MPNNKTYQNNNTILGQNIVNPASKRQFQSPDTDAREIVLMASDSNIDVNLGFDHAFITIKVPVNSNLSTFNVNSFLKADNRSLINLTLDNSGNASSKTFVFTNDFKFLDDPSSSILVNPGKIQIWYGAIVNGKIYLRVQSDSTN
jgi:hypothetical protein